MTRSSITLSATSQKKVAVFSHERSGTHFLMNTLADNFGYIVEPWWNLDFETGINFHAPKNIYNYLRKVHNMPVLNILKSHHSIGFFQEITDYLIDQFHIFYIYRDPRDVMVSFWKLLQDYKWHEGPKTRTVGEFIRSAPSGALMRYQQSQEPNMLLRWAHHVEGWLDFSSSAPAHSFMMLSYEYLNTDYEAAVRQIGAALKKPVNLITRPDVNIRVIGSGEGKINSFRNYFTLEDEDFLEDQIGNLMISLGLFQKTQTLP